METALVIASVIVGFSIVFAAVIATFGERQGPSPVGRYRLFPSGEGGCFLLDTRTGRLWERKAGSPTWSESAGVPWAAEVGRREAP